MRFQILNTLLFILLCHSSQASLKPLTHQAVVTISAGPGWYQTQQHQDLYLQPNFLNTYISNDTTRVLANGALFLGAQTSWHEHLQTQIGIAGALFSQAQVAGQIWELGDPLFNNFTYQYKINHSHVALAGKILSNMLRPSCLLYVSGSVGVARNQSSGFYSTPLIFESLPEPAFSSHNETALTYTLGIGIAHPLNQHWQTGIGYMFSDEGKSTLGLSSSHTTSNRLTLNHLYVNTVQFSLSYLS